MKSKVWLLATVILWVTYNHVTAQEQCRVLNPRIAGSYTGPCKKGLADGKGEAYGTDQYSGDFRKGLPNGRGKYIWENGDTYEGSWKNGTRDGEGTYRFRYEGRDSVITGIWENDIFIGEKKEVPYVIKYKNSVSRISVISNGNLPNVSFKFSRAGGGPDGVENLMFQASSGEELIKPNYIAYQQVEYPFECVVRFNAPNLLHTAMLNCEVRFVINEPGGWQITIYY